ncbi:CDGSH iron-sulfur domain-containing protein [bacterium]|nr:CDGSH iron-sulfur domain-containing protein [bacterium]
MTVSQNGPYLVTGGPELVDVDRGEGTSTEHFALCRCGASKNKPFCDGSHWSIRFEDEKN